MALPLAPVAAIALRYGTVAIATYALARRVENGRRDQRAEDALDDIQEGVTLRRDAGQMNTTGRFRRVLRLRPDGPGVEIDFTSISRISIRKIE